MRKILASLTVFIGISAFSQTAVLTDPWLLREMGVKALSEDLSAKVAYAVLSPLQEMRLHQLSHLRGRCGGYEVLPQQQTFASTHIENIFARIKRLQRRDLLLSKDLQIASLEEEVPMAAKPEIEAAVALVDKARIEANVRWYSSFPNRDNRGRDPNLPINALKTKIEEEILSQQPSWTLEVISHDRTAQNSLRVSIPGSRRPSEIVVLGGHADSISFRGNAPGADDNASGTADVLETLHVLAASNFSPDRTVDFFFYAGEESGLLGSAEIAASYKSQRKDVIGVMQLDMTLFAGSGPLRFSNMTDFTTPTLRKLIEDLNRVYVGGEVIHSECGYGCSDHASWYRNGFATVMPFESHMNEYNGNIHSPRDVVDSNSNFEHAAMFAKLAVSYVMEVSTTSWRAF
jgi:leucyl aminopeptidase